jgi:hypothetical protein
VPLGVCVLEMHVPICGVHHTPQTLCFTSSRDRGAVSGTRSRSEALIGLLYLDARLAVCTTRDASALSSLLAVRALSDTCAANVVGVAAAHAPVAEVAQNQLASDVAEGALVNDYLLSGPACQRNC